MDYGPVSAKVNNRVEGMHYRVYNNKDVEFLSLRSTSGWRAYVRSLFFVLCKAVHDLYPDGKVYIDIPVSNGYYCDLNIGHYVTYDDAPACVLSYKAHDASWQEIDDSGCYGFDPAPCSTAIVSQLMRLKLAALKGIKQVRIKVLSTNEMALFACQYYTASQATMRNMLTLS